MTDGWIKLYRCISDWVYADKPEYVAVWVHLLLMANRQEKTFSVGHAIINIGAGSLVTGRDKLAKITGVHRSTLERVLKRLESEHQIEQQIFTKYRIITITNWHKYQQGEQEKEQQMSSKRATSEQQVSTIQEVKKLRSKEVKKNIGHPSLDEVILYCRERSNSVDPEKWYDHYESNGWKVGKNPMKDWRAAVRTWEKSGYNSTQQRLSAHQQRVKNNKEVARRLKEKLANEESNHRRSDRDSNTSTHGSGRKDDAKVCSSVIEVDSRRVEVHSGEDGDDMGRSVSHAFAETLFGHSSVDAKEKLRKESFARASESEAFRVGYEGD